MRKSKWKYLKQEDILQILMEVYNEFGYLKYTHYKKLASERRLPGMNVILNKLNKKWSEILKLLKINNSKFKLRINIDKNTIKIDKNIIKIVGEHKFPDIEDIYLKCGVYKILNIYNNKIYIGSSINLYNRFCHHASELKSNIHKNKHLQSSWNKYGAGVFVFEVIEYINDKDNLLRREQFWIDYYKSYIKEIGYNICKIAGSCLGIIRSTETRKKMSNSKKGVKKSEETKQKMRKPKYKSLTKIKNGTYKEVNRKPKNKEKLHKQISELKRGSNNPCAKLNEKDVREIKILIRNGVKNKEIAKKFNVSDNAISSIKHNKRWKHVLLDGDIAL